MAPGSIEHLDALRILYMQMKDWTRAETVAREIYRRMPGNPNARNLLIEIERLRKAEPNETEDGTRP